MQILKTFFLAATLGLSASCLKQSESIDPIAPVKTLAEIQRETMMTTALEAAGNSSPSGATKINVEKSPEDTGLFYLNMKYKIKDLDVFDPANIPNGFESLSNSLIRMLANIFIKMSGGQSVDVGEIEIPLTDLHLDFQVIKSIKIKTIRIQYSKSMGEEADFSFIKSLDINKISGEKILSYKKSLNQCDFKCIDFVIQNGSVLDMIKETNNMKIVPSLSISKLPGNREMKLDGDIDLQIGLKLPF